MASRLGEGEFSRELQEWAVTKQGGSLCSVFGMCPLVLPPLNRRRILTSTMLLDFPDARTINQNKPLFFNQIFALGWFIIETENRLRHREKRSEH